MDHPEGAGSKRADRVEFDRRVHVDSTRKRLFNWQNFQSLLVSGGH